MGIVQDIAYIFGMAINLYIWVIIINVIMSWLIAFNIINPYNQFVSMIWNTANALISPALKPIKRFVPDFGGIDISPVILILLLLLIQRILGRIAVGMPLL